MLFSRTSFMFNYYKYKRKVFDCFIKTTYRNFAQKQVSCNPQKILFFGTDTFSLPSLKALHKYRNSNNLGVVTSFKSPANCVRSYAEQENIKIYKWPVTAEQCAAYHLGIVVSFGHLIPAHIIEAFPCGMINVHASLLPRWRGAAPIIYAIMNNDVKTGVSIMKIEPHRFDIGDILAQREILIKSDVYMPDLHATLANAGADLLLQTLTDYSNCHNKARKQNESEATYAPKITNAITEVDWSKYTALELYNRYRALYGFKPLVTHYLGKQVELLNVRLPKTLPVNAPKIPGGFYYHRVQKSLIIACAGAETHLEVLQLRLEGKPAMSANDFNNGFLRRHKQSEQMQFTPIKNTVCC